MHLSCKLWVFTEVKIFLPSYRLDKKNVAIHHKILRYIVIHIFYLTEKNIY